MREEGKTKNRAAIALTMIFCVMALTSLFAVKTSINKIQDHADLTDSAQSTGKAAEDAQASVQTPIVDSKDNNTSVPDAYIMPVDGAVQLKYSMDSLVYSKTLDQYMTHPGTDISAELSTGVKASADGTVTKVYHDDRYGTTVQITHEDGLVSVYSNLSDQGHVETGDEVVQGQRIGCIGDTALFESLEETHLHFEILKDGESVDPGDYIPALKK